MKPNITPLERAFELARSGRFHSTSDVKKALVSEGYSVATLTGATLLRQLRGIITDTTSKLAAKETG